MRSTDLLRALAGALCLATGTWAHGASFSGTFSGNGSGLKRMIENVKEHYPKRFIVFANVSFDNVGAKGWTEKAVKQLEEDVKNGANGLKIFKNLGFSVNDVNGTLRHFCIAQHFSDNSR